MGFVREVSGWRWYVCGMLLLATMLNYMDRQTLPQVATDIKSEFQLKDVHYGWLETGFGLAFAIGAVSTGFLVDRWSVRLMYPAVVLGWSAAGFATAFASDFPSLLACRIALGFFEAGQWPCALTTTQRILSRQERTLGNGILQSGAAVGAIFTPLVVQLMMEGDSTLWRGPFQVIGLLGLAWIGGWFFLVGRGDLDAPAVPPADEQPAEESAAERALFIRRFLVLVVVVIVINMCWQFFRAWLPKFLRESHHYSARDVNFFIMAYYLATDLGSLGVGWAARWLPRQGWSVHLSRLVLFTGCAVLTSLSVVAAGLPASWHLLALLCVIGFGALGLFPNFYSFSQELTTRHQGKVTGILGFITWTVSAPMHPLVGARIDETGSYAAGLILAGLVPLIGCAALWLFWGRSERTDPEVPSAAEPIQSDATHAAETAIRAAEPAKGDAIRAAATDRAD
jgi:ACS family hexuronate transporter-like MFS transporter